MDQSNKTPQRSANMTGPQTGAMSSAIEAALNAHYNDFRRFLARRVGDAATAEDVLQNFCIKVMRSGTELRDDKSAVGWLYTVLRSVLTDHYRKEARRRDGNAAYVQDQMVLSEQSTETDHDTGLCGCVKGLMLDLRPEYGEVLRRLDFNEESREKVSADMGLSQNNLRVRLHRARQAMGELLKGHCSGCCDDGFRDCFCNLDCTTSDSGDRPGKSA